MGAQSTGQELAQTVGRLEAIPSANRTIRRASISLWSSVPTAVWIRTPAVVRRHL